MLRITEIPGKKREIILRLEGRLTGSRVEVLETLCLQHMGNRPAAPLVLDMSGVGYVDDEGVGALGRLRGKGVELVNCSPFVRLLLRWRWGGGGKKGDGGSRIG